MASLKWNTGKLYYSTVELGYQQFLLVKVFAEVGLPVAKSFLIG